VPHVIEDSASHVPERFGLTPAAGRWLFGLFIAAQVVAALGAIDGRTWGASAVFLIGLVWVAAAVGDHYRAFMPSSFRDGLPSRAWVWILVGLQGAAAGFAARAVWLLRYADEGPGGKRRKR
jgi:hypothetical protein